MIGLERLELEIRRLAAAVGATIALDTAYIDGAAMMGQRSSGRYLRHGPRRVRYIDLGVAKGSRL